MAIAPPKAPITPTQPLTMRRSLQLLQPRAQVCRGAARRLGALPRLGEGHLQAAQLLLSFA